MNFKQILKEILPPFILEVRRRRKLKSFFGVYDNFYQIENENPWDDAEWQTLSINKLEETLKDIKKDELLATEYYPTFLLLINQLSKRKECCVMDFGGGDGHCIPLSETWFN